MFLAFSPSSANAQLQCLKKTSINDNPQKPCSSYAEKGECEAAVAYNDDGTARGTEFTSCIWGEAFDNNAFVDTMCNALRIVTGNGGKAFAAFAIISVGIGFFTGKVSWGLMIGVTCGIAAMFGAPTIVAAIGGGAVANCN